jgi:hypothetical protein
MTNNSFFRKLQWAVLVAIFAFSNITAQDNVGIGTLTPNAKALLDLTSTDKGLMVPRMTTALRLAINPAGNADAALLVYDLNDNLFYFWNSTQWVPFPQAAGGGNNISLTYNPVTGELTLVDNGGTLTANIAPNTDNQTLTLNTVTNILSISNGNSVDLTPYVNTDNQNLTAATLTGTTLTIEIQNGTPVSVDLSSLLGTDNQTLTLTGTDLSISNGNTVDLSPFVNTDNQDLTAATLTGTVLTIEIQNGAPVSVDLNSLLGTDEQDLIIVGDSLLITNGQGVDLTPYINTDNQDLTAATLTGNTLTIEIQNGAPVSVDLSALLGTDNQTLTLTGTDLTISNGNTVDLSPFVNTDNQDLTAATLTGTVLTIEIQNGAPVSVDLNSLLGTDEQDLVIVGDSLLITNGQGVDLSQYGGDWKLLGNAGTDPSVNFLGTTDAQDLVFRTNNTERVRTLSSNGFVGIGTPSPIARLDVWGNIHQNGTSDIAGQGTYLNWNFNTVTSINGDPVNQGMTHFVNQRGTGPGGFQFEFFDGSDNFLFSPVVIRPSGNVGIGTTQPLHKLMIVDESNAPIGIYEYNDFDGANIRGYRARGSVAAPAAIQLNDPIIRLSAFGYTGANFVQRGQIGIEAAENWTGAANGTQIVFRTTLNGTTAPVERVRIANYGHVGIGTTTPNYRLHLHEEGTNFGQPAIQLTNTVTGTGVNDGARLASQGLDFWVDNRSNGNLLFATNAFERVRINPAGFVGVATTTPQNRMDVAGALAVGSFAGVNTAPANGFIVSGRVRIGVPVATTVAPALAENTVIQLDQSGGYARIGNYNSDPAFGNVNPGTSWAGGVGALAVGMNRNAGRSNVDFWNTSANGQAAANQDVDRGFDWRRFNQTGNEQLLMTLNGIGNLTISGTNYFTSDKRLKSDIKDFDMDVLDKVLQLKPSTYSKTNSALNNGEHVFYGAGENSVADFGFIAQEVFEIFPELVYKPADESKELWAVDYARLSVFLTKAIQQQQEEIEALKLLNNSYKAACDESNMKYEELKTELEYIKSFIFQRAER